MGGLKVKYSPTGKILANHFTEPSQGTAFRKFRADIQGITEDTPDTYLGWDIHKNLFIPIPKDGVGRSDVKT